MTTHQRLQRTMRNPARAARRARQIDRQARNGRGHGKAAWGQPATREDLAAIFAHGPAAPLSRARLPKWLSAWAKAR